MSDLKLYLTSLEPDMGQTVYSQSIGGYCSTSLVYPETTLSDSVGLYDTSFILNVPQSGGWQDWQGITYININNEMIKISPLVDGNISVEERGANGIINFHLSGDAVRASSSKELFNNVFNSDYKQYRCVAIKNDGALTAHDVSVFFKKGSQSQNCTIKMAIERPKSKYLSSISTSRTSLTVIDATLIGAYPDNYFVNAFLKPSGEIGSIVQSFDSLTGTFVLTDSSIDTSNKFYEVYPSPAQRIKTGTTSPIVGTYVSPFYVATESSPIYLSLDGGVDSSSSSDDLSPNDLFYIWIEKTLSKGVSSLYADDFVINVNYSLGSY